MSELIVSYLIMVFFVVIQSYFYFKVDPSTLARLPIMVSTTSFSMIITPLLMSYEIAGTPYIQLFFIIYQILLFFFAMMEYLKLKSG